ncbi:hypothetical protein E8E13_001511 [Curvularia kusanoi]|uniref:Cytochrome P450 n=1 Tax=Curvularia kusanoi TaxID=90978 RepID=A0A9P4T857_CURKU|nr:hypothetical protein E8E13_001511 [Curvularia kusanoi]
MIAAILITALALLLGTRIATWIRNYIRARAYGLPIVLLPVSFNEPLWMLFRPLFAWVEHLPLGLGNWYLYTTMGWPTEDGSRSLNLYGENFVLCSPVDNVVVTCEPAVVESVWTETRDLWRMPESQSQLFTFFGQNVSSTAGEDWKRHRKITIQAFSERTMASVWREARRQTRVLKASLEGEHERSLGRVRSSVDVLAMQVLGVVAFGQEKDLEGVSEGHKMSLMESMGFVLQHILLTVVFNSLKAPDFLLPKVLRKLKTAVAETRLYMQELVLAHTQSSSASNPSSSASSRPTTLLSAIVQANEAEKHSVPSTTSTKPKHLTASELYGNIFVFNLGGYETTASTVTFALPFLALHPEIQTWIADEIAQHITSSPDTDADTDTDYTTTYPHLPRTLALMYETLRLASPAPLFVKAPTAATQLILTTPSGPRRITITPDTLVGMNQYGAHLSARWGADAASFDPRRFIRKDPTTGEEKFVTPVVSPEGPLFAAWMMGPRACPARKFSQVEFVGIMVELLREWRVEVLREPGEGEEMARERVWRVLRDEKYFNVSAHLKRPGAAGVRFVRR